MKDSDFTGKRLILIGGKGGVGKTTCSAALAYHFAARGERTLLISSDPAPSLSDIFETSIGPQETAIDGMENLWGLEIDSALILKRWKERFGPQIQEVLSAFVKVDDDFVDYIGSAPGIEEEYMLTYIKERVEDGTYDRVIWDSAPAGHTLRLLHLPQLFLQHLEGAAKFYLHLYGAWERMAHSVHLNRSKQSLLEIIEGWKELSQAVLDFLHDPQRMALIIVTIAESLGVKLTERILKDLEDFGLSVGHLIVNELIQEADCAFHRERKKMQLAYLERLRADYAARMSLRELPLLPQEVKGLAKIRHVADLLFLPS